MFYRYLRDKSMALLSPSPVSEITSIRASASPIGHADTNPFSELVISDKGMNTGTFQIRWRSKTADADFVDLGNSLVGNILFTASGDAFYNYSTTSTRAYTTHGTGANYTAGTNATLGSSNSGAAVALFEGRIENGEQTVYRWVNGSTATHGIVGRRVATLQKLTPKTGGTSWTVEAVPSITGYLSTGNFGHLGGVVMVFHNRYLVVCGPVDLITVYDIDDGYGFVDSIVLKPTAENAQKKTAIGKKVSSDSFIVTMDYTIGQSTYYFGVSATGYLISKPVRDPDVYSNSHTNVSLPSAGPPIVYGFGPNKDHAIVTTTGIRTGSASISVMAALYKVTPTELVRRKFTSGYFSSKISTTGQWPGRGGFVIPTAEGNGFYMTAFNTYDYGYRLIDLSML